MPLDDVSTRSRPKAAGPIWTMWRRFIVFQHAAARRRLSCVCCILFPVVCFNTQPPEGGCFGVLGFCGLDGVSTRSRPKAAAPKSCLFSTDAGFNTQPPEGGCLDTPQNGVILAVSTRSRPKAAEPLSKALLHQVSQP